MPDFGNASSSLNLDHKLSKDELIRAIRFFIAAEYEAIQMYMQVADATDDELAKKVLKSVSDEEIVHAGEFLAVLKKLSPEEETLYKEGQAEVEGEAAKKTKEPTDPEDVRKKKLQDMFG
jgi:rubrerythrin